MTFTIDERFRKLQSKLSQNKSKDKQIGKALKYKRPTAMELFKIKEDQGGLCAICCDFLGKDTKNHCADHCHTTHKQRGILCRRCNMALGLFKDNRGYLQSAIHYLDRHNPLPEASDET